MHVGVIVAQWDERAQVLDQNVGRIIYEDTYITGDEAN